MVSGSAVFSDNIGRGITRKAHIHRILIRYWVTQLLFHILRHKKKTYPVIIVCGILVESHNT